jgi:hypothetical protein
MFIRTYMRAPGTLYIVAYSFSNDEWATLEETLRIAGIEPNFFRIEPSTFRPEGDDPGGREGRIYAVDTWGKIGRLAQVLQGRFNVETGVFTPTTETGDRYACREMGRSGFESGCEELVAPNHVIARTKCGIIASKNNWFGGEALPGHCEDDGKGFFSRVFR